MQNRRVCQRADLVRRAFRRLELEAREFSLRLFELTRLQSTIDVVWPETRLNVGSVQKLRLNRLDALVAAAHKVRAGAAQHALPCSCIVYSLKLNNR